MESHNFAMKAPADIAREKDELRRTMRGKLREMPPEQRAKASGRIVAQLMGKEGWFPPGGVVAMFGGLKSEPDLLPLLPWLLGRGTEVAFFAVAEDGTMAPYRVSHQQDLVNGVLGILEPRRDKGAQLRVADLDVILVPGLAFSTTDGARLGRGRGHYDRVLSSSECRARTVGVGLGLQMVSHVPREAHDVLLHALVSEDGWREFTPRSKEVPS
jgi:5-formyltetrahydrofolate cyclo-ligase